VTFQQFTRWSGTGKWAADHVIRFVIKSGTYGPALGPPLSHEQQAKT
jgi:hypothetical protein